MALLEMPALAVMGVVPPPPPAVVAVLPAATAGKTTPTASAMDAPVALGGDLKVPGFQENQRVSQIGFGVHLLHNNERLQRHQGPWDYQWHHAWLVSNVWFGRTFSSVHMKV